MNKKYINDKTKKVLQIDEIISKLIISSDIGKLIFKNLQPYLPGNESELIKEYKQIEKLHKIIELENFVFEEISSLLNHFKNIEKILQIDGTFEIFEIQEIKSFLHFYLLLVELLKKYNIESIFGYNDFRELYNFLDLDNKKIPSFYLSDRYSDKLSELRHKLVDNSQKIKQQKTKILEAVATSLKIQNPKQKVVISRMNKSLFDILNDSEYYFLQDENYANYTFILHKNNRINELEIENRKLLKKLNLEEKLVRKQISEIVTKELKVLQNAFYQVGHFDLTLSKAKFMLDFQCCIPEITSKTIELKNVINIPKKEALQKLSYQPIDIDFTNKLNIITGANMAGKTTILQTIGQVAFLSSMVIPIPAESAKICLFDSIYFSAASSFSDRMDLSSFGAEVVNITQALKEDGFNLYLIDEFARGTNPYEGEAFSHAVLESFIEKEAITISTTHFQTPSQILDASHFQVKGLSAVEGEMNFKGDSIDDRIDNLHNLLDYSLFEVEPNSTLAKSALIVASSLGIDDKIIQKAKEYLE